ncbi:MAG: amino acid permease [Planctomycetes bacterium]|nr:amino acid permease [Planctomycetota bacterium]
MTVGRPSEPNADTGPAPRLGVGDSVSIIVGIVVGASIFKVSPIICSGVSSAWGALGVWLLGGLLSLCGGLCYAELAAAYPRSGGDYVYLTRAWGPAAGFLFGWAHLTGILTGSIGVLAFVFAEYAAPLVGLAEDALPWLGLAAVGTLSAINMLGVALGKTAQNVLTAAKALGLGAIIVAGFWAGRASLGETSPPTIPGGFALAMILVLYAYGGWSDAAFVAAEVRHPQRNVPKALVIGIGAIAVVYLLINVAYLRVLGFEGLRNSKVPAADTLAAAFGPAGGRLLSVLVVVSALGGINGLILTGSRVHAALGRDHALFALLGRWHPVLKTPVWSLATQAWVTALLVMAVGIPTGRAAIDAGLRRVGLDPIQWTEFGGGFETLIAATAPVFWTFFLLTGLAVFVLHPEIRRRELRFRLPAYPLTPLAFCLMCAFMMYSSIAYAGRLSLVSLLPLALGVPLYAVSRSLRSDS